eukprot:3343647-Heterocapsa_arctica.AAC.1
MVVVLRAEWAAALVKVARPRENSEKDAVLRKYTTDFHKLRERHGDQVTAGFGHHPTIVEEREMGSGVWD